MSKTISLKELLPKRLSTPRLDLELFDYSQERYECLLSCMNSTTTKARMGDWNIHTPEQFDRLIKSARLSPTSLGADSAGVNVDQDVYYLPRIKQAASDEAQKANPLIGGFSIAQPSPDLPPDAGWILLEAYHGHGYAVEAAQEVLRMGRELLGLPEIVSIPNKGNLQSIRVAQKLGLVENRVISDTKGNEIMLCMLPGRDIEKYTKKPIFLFEM